MLVEENGDMIWIIQLYLGHSPDEAHGYICEYLARYP